MKLYMKQKVFSWTDQFSVADESGAESYTVQGELFSWGKKLHVYDASGREAAFIRQKLMSWMPRYTVEIGGAAVAAVVREFTFFRPSYRVEGLPWRMQGDFWGHEYQMLDGSREVMRLSKAWFTWGDSYELSIARPEDALLCLCVALAVDCAMDSGNNQSN